MQNSPSRETLRTILSDPEAVRAERRRRRGPSCTIRQYQPFSEGGHIWKVGDCGRPVGQRYGRGSWRF